MSRLTTDVCIIGAGAAGLSVAAGTAQLGLKTILVERGKMGGECLNVGCVPSKALLAAAKLAHTAGSKQIAGVAGTQPTVDFACVKEGVDRVIATIAPHDSVQRFEQMGVRVLRDSARFRSARTLEVGEDIIEARSFVIATGSRPVIPKIPGLDPSLALTNETIFKLREKPDRLVIVGGGPIGIEMAVAHRRLGAAVTVIELAKILPHDEPDLVETLRCVLREEDIALLEDAQIASIRHTPGAVEVHVRHDGRHEVVAGSHLLVATGRAALTGDLQLDAAGIESNAKGIVVDDRLRTRQRHVFALGDVIDAPHFTHVASYQAGIVVRNLAFRLPAKVDYDALPWVTYSDPELAHVGLTEARARERHGRITVQNVSLARNDRAIAERRTTGSIKVVVGARGRVLGASILAPGAGEMIGLWCLAIKRKLTLRAVADLMLPYPTLGEIGKAAASQHYAPTLFGSGTRTLVRALQWLPGS